MLLAIPSSALILNPEPIFSNSTFYHSKREDREYNFIDSTLDIWLNGRQHFSPEVFRPFWKTAWRQFQMNALAPRAREERLIIKHLPDEVLIYDLDRDKAHCLNQTAARIWQNCDGKKSVSQLRELMERQIGNPVPEEIIWLALDQLEKFKLLDRTPVRPVSLSGMSRRELVRRIGVVAIGIPVVLSITAPTAQAQASGLPPGSCCGNPSQCASNSCNQNPTCIGTPAPSTKACA